MNRLILIGNGFDLAHGLKTKYADFIEWYWKQLGKSLLHGSGPLIDDGICRFMLKDNVGLVNWYDVWPYHYGKELQYGPWREDEVLEIAKQDRDLCDFNINSAFFEKICNELEKGWVDIEDVYYALLKKSSNPKQLNDDLDLIKCKLVDYLSDIQSKQINPTIFNPKIQKQILDPFNKEDIALGSMSKWNEMLKSRMKYENKDWDILVEGYNLEKGIKHYSSRAVEVFKKAYGGDINFGEINQVDAVSCPTYRLPNNIMLLDFNYTNTADLYLPNADKFTVNHIHGSLSNSEGVIFGYGDERDNEYNVLMDKKDNEYLQHIKSFRYLEASNYRDMLSFIESAPYQLCIMGHSCGLSDRTLLATLFEHRNCVSIKPYYYKRKDGTDNYRELVQNIARNFKDPTLMRDRVVRKDRCEPLG
ncbi:MAG: hypothetical protein IKZ56_07550 [Bacteroidales bacterium]|nr:hypothetical protein [Bacteroidales bacterium]